MPGPLQATRASAILRGFAVRGLSHEIAGDRSPACRRRRGSVWVPLDLSTRSCDMTGCAQARAAARATDRRWLLPAAPRSPPAAQERQRRAGRQGRRAAAGRRRPRSASSPSRRGRSAWSPSCRAGSKRRASRRCARAPPASCCKRLFRRRQRRQGRPAAVPDRLRALPGDASPARRPTLARAQANLTQAAAQAERYKPLLEANAISKQDYVNAVAAQKQAEADVAAAKASVQSGQINLGYAAVTAPISGPHRPRAGDRRRAGRPGRGDAARADPADQSDVRQLHPVDDRRAAPAPRHRQRQVQARRRRRCGAACSVVLEDGSVYPQPGKLLFSDLTRRPDLGPDHAARRGAEPDRRCCCRACTCGCGSSRPQTPTGIVVPQQAVHARHAPATRVMVVGADGKVAPRPVKVGARAGRQLGHPRRPEGRRAWSWSTASRSCAATRR